MPVKVTLTDNSATVKAQLDGNRKAALEAMGIKSVNLILNQMESGYGKPIRQTGDLMRDVQYEVERSGEGTVDVGNTLYYGPYVHEGTVRMKARHYIRDALISGTATQSLKTVAEAALKIGFE
jgi:hypothetical protein